MEKLNCLELELICCLWLIRREAHPLLSPNDEVADYEKWDKSNLNGTEAKTPGMLQYEYAREALKNGLLLERRLGVNPFKFGMVGSTDAHTALTAVEEDNFFGKHSGVEPGPHRWEHVVIEAPDPKFTIKGWQQAAAGYAGVWATENTREAIFDAMKRKETYATTGPRMVVRFFGGWDFTMDDAQSRLPAGVGYAKGVPMGGDLRKGPSGKSPSFLVAALKDSYSGNLDRIQIVKGWLDKDGKTHEKVYDVVWGGDRKPVGTGSSRRSATRSMWRRRPGRTPSAPPSSARPGPTRISTRSSRPSTTPGSSRSLRHAGPHTRPNVSESRCRRTFR